MRRTRVAVLKALSVSETRSVQILWDRVLWDRVNGRNRVLVNLIGHGGELWQADC